jgi:hypothetical protein
MNDWRGRRKENKVPILHGLKSVLSFMIDLQKIPKLPWPQYERYCQLQNHAFGHPFLPTLTIPHLLPPPTLIIKMEEKENILYPSL